MAALHEEWLGSERRGQMKELLLLQDAKSTKERLEEDKGKEPES